MDWLTDTENLNRKYFVPRGLLVVFVVKLLREGPMSGAEIVNGIKQETTGFWKPSFGGIYPLLSRMVDSGFIAKEPSAGGVTKRYFLTDMGKQTFRKKSKIMRNMREQLSNISFMMLMLGMSDAFSEEARPHYELIRKAFDFLFQIRSESDGKSGSMKLERVTKELAKAVESLEESLRELKMTK